MPSLSHDETLILLEQFHIEYSSGNKEKAMEIGYKIPLNPALALTLKDLLGSEELKKSKFDFSEVEAKYGTQWLDS